MNPLEHHAKNMDFILERVLNKRTPESEHEMRQQEWEDEIRAEIAEQQESQDTQEKGG